MRSMGRRWRMCEIDLRSSSFKKDEEEKMVKWQSKLTFNGIHECYEKYDSFTFKQNEVLMDKPIYLGFSVLELSKVLVYETYYDKFHYYFADENIRYHYGDTDAMVLSIETKDIVEDLYTLRDLFDFSNLNREHKLFNEKNTKVVGKFKIETPGSIWIDEFVCLRSKAYSYRCGGESSNKLKGISKSQSKNIRFEEYYNCLLRIIIEENVRIIELDLKIMKYFCKRLPKIHYLHLMRSVVI